MCLFNRKSDQNFRQRIGHNDSLLFIGVIKYYYSRKPEDSEAQDMKNTDSIKKKNREILNYYKPLAAFLAGVLGPACEVVLHDVTNPENSIIAIENGYHSGRKVGDPLTDLARQIIDSKEYLDKDFLSGYKGQNKEKSFISSTFCIKNGGTLVGLLCINRNTEAVENAENALQLLLSQFNLQRPQTSEVAETLDAGPAVADILPSLIQKTVAEFGVDSRRMSKEEKIEVVRRLRGQKIFDLKGAVRETAAQLRISEPTVYRYLKM